jgi:hypothetical protein
MIAPLREVKTEIQVKTRFQLLRFSLCDSRTSPTISTDVRMLRSTSVEEYQGSCEILKNVVGE